MKFTASNLRVKTLPSIPFKNKKALPVLSAVYLVLDGKDRVIYVGETGNLRKRWLCHKLNGMVDHINGCRIAYIPVEPGLRLDTEKALISYFDPLYNAQYKNGNPPGGNKTNFSKEFKEQQFEPKGKEAFDTEVRARCSNNLKSAIKQNAPDMSEWVRLAREEGWL